MSVIYQLTAESERRKGESVMAALRLAKAKGMAVSAKWRNISNISCQRISIRNMA
jgi:hypothetical protein